jgi:hypothetical protein
MRVRRLRPVSRLGGSVTNKSKALVVPSRPTFQATLTCSSQTKPCGLAARRRNGSKKPPNIEGWELRFVNHRNIRDRCVLSHHRWRLEYPGTEVAFNENRQPMSVESSAGCRLA